MAIGITAQCQMNFAVFDLHLPCSDYDKEALAVLGSEFEIDFVSLAYTRTRCGTSSCCSTGAGKGCGRYTGLAMVIMCVISAGLCMHMSTRAAARR
jgi:hypothetical protein